MFFLFAIVSPFNNCDPVNNLSGAGQQSSNSTSALSVQPSGPTSITVGPGISQFTLTGACNTDIYPQTTIWWTIENAAGVDIWDSYIAGGQNYLSTCSSGQFGVVVTVPCTPGFSCSGLAATYSLHMHIVGILATGVNSNANATSTALTLLP